LRFEVRGSKFEVRSSRRLRVTGRGLRVSVLRPFVLVPESNKFLELSGLKIRRFEGWCAQSREARRVDRFEDEV
jgi:hypothetical protein